ncbi:MAG: hypothetical protein JXX29_12585 [Deltaproteobacteria bacterium]|nr:hypothetical protein [Deltaproteobacteria bacterium]MBN2672512.1 hypothetical protein [Deltaproteobacteria bacterium]
MKLPKKCVVDTNVPQIANLAACHDSNSDVPEECILACIDAIDHVIRQRALVIDKGGEIFEEYRHNLSMSGQPGQGDFFLKWVHDHQWTLPKSQLVTITREDNDAYKEFPAYDGLTGFDPSDKKFVAVANAHPKNPPILQATDSKWWGWKESLAECGISVVFLCSEYVKEKYAKKISK